MKGTKYVPSRKRREQIELKGDSNGGGGNEKDKFKIVILNISMYIYLQIYCMFSSLCKKPNPQLSNWSFTLVVHRRPKSTVFVWLRKVCWRVLVCPQPFVSHLSISPSSHTGRFRQQ